MYTAFEASFWLSDSSIISRVPWNRAPEVSTKNPEPCTLNPAP